VGIKKKTSFLLDEKKKEKNEKKMKKLKKKIYIYQKK
jgi:hypothetical protein